jgi:hypothetical protein
MRFFGVALGVAVVAVGMLIGGTATATATATATPARGISITGYTFDPNKRFLAVRVTSYGWKMYPRLIGSKTNKPDGGHWNLYVNGKVRARSATMKATATNLPRGPIRFFVALANNNNSAVKGAARSTIFTQIVN